MQLEAAIFEASISAYRRIAVEAAKLRTLNLSFAAIAKHLGVSEKTVAKALQPAIRN